MKSENTDKKRKRGTDPGPLVFRLGLLGFSAFVLLDTFVIPKNVISVQDLTAQAAAAEEASNEVSEDGNSAASDIISEDGDSAGTSGIISEDSDSADTSDAAVSDNASDSASDPVVTATSYTADGVQITIST